MNKFLILLSTFYISVSCFGSIGHYLSGFIAQEFLEPQTRDFLYKLNPQNLSKIATFVFNFQL